MTDRTLHDADEHPLTERSAHAEELERDRLIQAVQARDQFLEGILDSLEGFVTVERDWRITFANEAAARIFQKSVPELLGADARELRPLRADEPAAELARAMTERVVVELDVADLAGERFYRGRAQPIAGDGLAVYIRDVTEQVRMQDTLLDSEHRFRTLADQSPFLIWVCGPDGGVEFVNRKYLEFFGVTEEDVQGMDWRPLVHPDDVDRYVGAFMTALAEHRPFACEARVRDAQGEWRWVDSRGVPRLSASGEYLGMVGSSPDVTDRRRVEEALRASEERYRMLFSAMDQGFCIIEKVETGDGQPSDYRYLVINPAFRRHTGLGEVVGRTIRDVVPDPDQSILDVYDEVVRTGRHRHFEAYEAALDLWVDVEAFPTTRPGQIAVLFTDISQRKRAQDALRENDRLLRTVLDNSRDGINMLDLRTGRYVFMNEAQVAMTGFTAQEINGISVEEAFARVHPEDRHISVEQQRRVAAGEDVAEPVEYRWRVKSGDYRWFSDQRKIVRDERGEPVALVGISRDITHRKRIEVARNRHNVVIGGIATILRAALTAPTEEELGEICLQVAVLLTESRFGFIGEVGADGLLQIVALSDSESECASEDGSDRLRLLDDLGLNSLYGRVLETGEPVMTGAPAERAESIGTPTCPRPLSSFLGLPLGDQDHVVGVLAVADREGGYRDEDLESLNAMVPVIREAFDRRRAEQGLRENDLRVAAQRERSRLARDLHDSVTQALFAATMKTEALTFDAELPAETSASVEEVRRLTRGALAQMRTLLLELRGDPLENVSLQQLLRHLVESTESRASTSVRLRVRGDGPAPQALHTPIYRITQEALNNVVRHAHASNAWVVLDLDEDRVRLEVGDDGVGFEPGTVDAGHLGLRSMRERAAEAGGELRVVTAAGEGTRVLADWGVEA